MHGAPHTALALAAGQPLAGEHDVPAQCLAAVFGLEVQVHQVQGGVLHLPRKVTDELAAQNDQKIVHIVVDVRFDGICALQLLHKGVQLLCGIVALVHLVPELTGKVGGGVDVFGLGDQLVIRLHSSPYTFTI